MSSTTRAPWYAKERMVHHPEGVKHKSEDGIEFVSHLVMEAPEDGTLLSKGKYPTKLTEADLSPSYLPVHVTKLCKGFVDTARISDAIYFPNTWINHVWKDDMLFVLFDGERFDEALRNVDPYTEKTIHRGERMISLWNSSENLLVFDGSDAMRVLPWAHVFAGLDVERLHDEMLEKVARYALGFPDELNLITVEEFEHRWLDAIEDAERNAQP